MVQHDPARPFYQAKERFGNDNLTVVLVKAPDVFAPDALDPLSGSPTGWRVPGVTRVESLTTVKNIKGEGDALDTEPLVRAPCRAAARSGAHPPRRAGPPGDRRQPRVAGRRATAITVYAPAVPAARRRLQPPPGPPGRRAHRARARRRGDGLPGRRAAHQVDLRGLAQDDLRIVTPSRGWCCSLTSLPLLPHASGRGDPDRDRRRQHRLGPGSHGDAGIAADVLTAIIPSPDPGHRLHRGRPHLSDYHHRLAAGDDKLAALRRCCEASAPADPRHHRDHGGRLRQPGHHRHHHAGPVRLRLRRWA